MSSSWPFKKVLITGGAGYLAAGVLRRLQGANGRALRLCRRPPPPAPSGGGLIVEDVIGDVRRPDLWDRLLEGVDLVYHFAGQTSVPVAESDPRADHETNVAPLLRLLESCRLRGMRPSVIFSGTVTQVGLTRSLPVDERFPDAPITVYDMHKSMAEAYLRHYAREGHVQGASLRLANVYGPGPAAGSADRGVLNAMIRNAIQGECLTIYGDGRHVRDYLYIDDAAEAFVAAASNIDALSGGYFVIGSGKGCPIVDAVELVAERVGLRTGKRPDVVHVPPPTKMSRIETRDFVGDSSLFASGTGWKPSVSLEEGIDRTIDAFLSKGAGRA